MHRTNTLENTAEMDTGTDAAGSRPLNGRLLKIVVIIAVILAATNIILALIGTIRSYSPIPFGDDWSGAVGFIHKIADHQVGAWFEPFTDHRIIIQRIVTWTDYRLFGGLGISELSLIITFYFSIGLFLTFYLYKSNNIIEYILYTCIVSCLMVSWVQAHNFTLGFQLQFVSTYFFAVLSFLSYSRPLSACGHRSSLASTIALGLCSAGSMANGPFVFPVLILQSLLLKKDKIDIIILVLVTIFVFVLYYHEGVFLSANPHVPASTPSGVVLFTLRLLGGPAWSPLNSDALCILLGTISITTGSVFLLAAISNLTTMTKARSFYVSVNIFSLMSAIIIAAGRSGVYSFWDIKLTYSSRYMIVPLLYWCSLFLLALDLSKGPRARAMIVAAIAPLVLILTVYQWHAVDDDVAGLFDRKLGVLSYKVGLGRAELMPMAFANGYIAVQEATWAAANGVGIYHSLPWLRDAGIVQYHRAQENDRACYGVLERVDPDPRGEQVSGWAVTRNRTANLLVLLVNEQGRTVGYGITGATRQDLRARGLPLESGWIGFAKPKSGPLTAYLYLSAHPCRLSG